MRQMTFVAFLSATLTVAPLVLAQRGAPPGGAGSGHMAGGFSGAHVAGGAMGHIGGGFAGRSYSRAPGFAGPGSGFQLRTPNFVSIAPSHGVFTAPNHAFGPTYQMPYAPPANAWHHDGRGDRDHDQDHEREYRHRSPYGSYGYGYGGYPYAYASSWELLPWDVSSDSTDSGDNAEADVQQQQAESAPAPDQGYRPEYDGSAQQLWAQPSVDSAGRTAAPPVAPEPALTLIFNDGHQETIHNYVLTSQDVIVLDQAASGRQMRIPLDSIDLHATEQAAQQAGLDFRPPA
jgi:hypothetical protein